MQTPWMAIVCSFKLSSSLMLRSQVVVRLSLSNTSLTKIDIVDRRGRTIDSDLAGSHKVVQYLPVGKSGVV